MLDYVYFSGNTGNDDGGGSTVIIVVIVVIILLVAYCCLILLFFYCYYRKEKNYQNKGTYIRMILLSNLQTYACVVIFNHD